MRIAPGAPCVRTECTDEATTLLVPPSTRQPIRAAYCRPCAELIAAEYQAKMGQTWTIQPYERP